MLRKSLLAFIFLFFSGILYAQDYPEHILFKDFPEQYSGLMTIRDGLEPKDTTVVIKEWDKLVAWAEQKDDVPLKYAMLIQKYRYVSDKRLTHPEPEKNILAIIDETREEELDYLNAMALQLLADYYWVEGKYATAFEYSTRAYNVYSTYSIETFPPKDVYLSAYGGRFYYFKDYPASIYYMGQAINANKGNNISMLNTQGLSFLFLGKYDSSRYFFDRAYKLAGERSDEGWGGIIAGNLGYMHHVSGNFKLARPYLEQEINLYYEKNKGSVDNVANSLSLLSDITLAEGDKVKALSYAKQAYGLIHPDADSRPNDYLVKSIYLPAARAYAANGESAIAYVLMDSAHKAKDRLNKETSTLILAGAKHKIDAERHLATIEEYEQEKQRNILMRNGLIAMIVLLFIISILLINRQRLKYLNKRNILEAEKLHTETELTNASEQLRSFTQSIADKNELIERFSTEIYRMQQGGYADIDKDAFARLQQSTILTDAEWADFQQKFEKVHHGFIKRLKQKLPGLSPVDTRFILLSKLKLSGKEMTAIMGISAEAVKQNRERLRNKLNISDTDNALEIFADSL